MAAAGETGTGHTLELWQRCFRANCEASKQTCAFYTPRFCDHRVSTNNFVVGVKRVVVSVFVLAGSLVICLVFVAINRAQMFIRYSVGEKTALRLSTKCTALVASSQKLSYKLLVTQSVLSSYGE